MIRVDLIYALIPYNYSANYVNPLVPVQVNTIPSPKNFIINLSLYSVFPQSYSISYYYF